jgi:hypothetical protein
MQEKSNLDGKQRLTRSEAEKLYPDEWVIFTEPSENDDGTFKDGVVFYHGKDQAKAYRVSGKVKGDRATYYTGIIPYDKYNLKLHDRKKVGA